MPRIRAIKHEYFTNDQLAQASSDARLLGIGLTTLADREGRLEDRPLRIRAQIFPYHQLDCDALLAELENAQFIHRYAVENLHYIQVLNFHRHQKPHPTERVSTIPPPVDIVIQNGDMGNGELVIGNGKRVMEKQSKPRRAENFPIPPESMLQLTDEDVLWCEQYAPHITDRARATLKWFAKQQSNPSRGKDIEAWKASWRGYMMNYSDGELSRNSGNGKTNYSRSTGIGSSSPEGIDNSIWDRAKTS